MYCWLVGWFCYVRSGPYQNLIFCSVLGEINLLPRVYNYKFSFVLPSTIPASVEGIIGYIRYTAVLHIDRPLWPNQSFEQHFTVLKTVNLNDEILLRV